MIIHVDLDAFYAAVEERDQPRLRGQPVIVAGAPEGRGVVAAANYEARRYGIHSAMAAATAKRLCPHGVFLAGRMAHYHAVSQAIRGVFQRYTPVIEPLALDEAFLDAGASERLFGSSVHIARRIKTEIAKEVGLVASVGVAPNKFLAKLASDWDKPDGFVVVEPGQEQAFLDPLPVSRLWGVGQVTEQALARLGIRTVAGLRQCGRASLVQHFGCNGEHLWALAQGLDTRPVVPDHRAKSISHELTFPQDTTETEVLKGHMMALTEQVAHRLRRQGWAGRVVYLKVRFADFRTLTRSRRLAAPTHGTQAIWHTVTGLFDTRLPQPLPAVRLLGVGVSDLEAPTAIQADLFDQPEQRLRSLDAVADRIQARFGAGAVQRGRGLNNPDRQ